MADYVQAGTVKLISGQQQWGKAGSNISQGDQLYIDTSDPNDVRIKTADCVTSQATAIAVGPALNDALIDQPVFYAAADSIVTFGSTALVFPETYILSEAGKMAPFADLASSDWLTYAVYSISTTQAVVMAIATGIQKP